MSNGRAKFQFFEKSFFLFFIISVLLHLLSLNRGNYLSISEILTVKNDNSEKVIKLRLTEEKKKTLQIVESNDSENLQNLKKAKERFLGKRDNYFEKETVARRIGKFTNSKSKGRDSENVQKKSVPKVKQQKQISLSDLGSQFTREVKQQEANPTQVNSNSKSKVTKQASSASSDYLNDVPLGELTQLNTMEFKFYGFYHRIKQKLEQYWGNSLREKAKKLYLSGKRMPGSAERITALVVVLDSVGNIVRVRLKSTSGVEELDNAAIESFNKAGPFPNPPKEMLFNGKAQIEWGFVVKT